METFSSFQKYLGTSKITTYIYAGGLFIVPEMLYEISLSNYSILSFLICLLLAVRQTSGLDSMVYFAWSTEIEQYKRRSSCMIP